MAGMAALNNLRNISKLMHWEEVSEQHFLLDVRSNKEFERGHVPNSINIPVNQLRARLTEISKDRPIAAFCQAGVRGHVATRILKQNGFDVMNVSGGYLTYCNKII